ncbi:MAG: hypothetical protein JO327_11770 [Nitrososphaeraceae archaeon]|nr:hypothetical protein [Nitrososphaeraceae archaeon]
MTWLLSATSLILVGSAALVKALSSIVWRGATWTYNAVERGWKNSNTGK